MQTSITKKLIAVGILLPGLAIMTIGAPGFLFGKPLVAHAATCAVPGSYSTIQDAVNDVTCDTITVAAGTYPENVTIAKSLA